MSKECIHSYSQPTNNIVLNKCQRCILSVWCRCGADVLPQLSFDLSPCKIKLVFENIMYIMFLFLSCLHNANQNLQFFTSTAQKPSFALLYLFGIILTFWSSGKL